MKKCSKCKIEKQFEEFNKRLSNKDGLSSQCKKCAKEYYQKNKEIIKNRSNNWRKNNKERKKQTDKKWAENNKERKLQNSIKWAENNKEKRKEISKRYYQNNKKECNERQKIYMYKRLKNDKLFKIITDIRRTIWHSFDKKNFTKKSRTYEILGCSYEEFKIHIEGQFQNWMTWDNHGAYTGNYQETWQYDHIIPLASVDSNLPIEEQYKIIIKLNHFSNFRPLCSRENLEKSDSIM